MNLNNPTVRTHITLKEKAMVSKIELEDTIIPNLQALVDSAKSNVNEAVVLICSHPNRCIILIGETHWTTGRPIPKNGRDMLDCPDIRYTLEALHQLDPQARILVEYSVSNTGPVTEQCVLADILDYEKRVERFDVRNPDASMQLHTAQTPEQYIYALNLAHEKHHGLCLTYPDVTLLLARALHMAYTLRESGNMTMSMAMLNMDEILRTNPSPGAQTPAIYMDQLKATMEYTEKLQEMKNYAPEFWIAVQNKAVIEELTKYDTSVVYYGGRKHVNMIANDLVHHRTLLSCKKVYHITRTANTIL